MSRFGFDFRAFNERLKEWIADFDANKHITLVIAAKMWLDEAVKLVENPTIEPTSEFIRDSKLLVAWCDHHGRPEPTIISEMLFLFTSGQVDRESDSSGAYIGSQMNRAALIIERILNRAILMGAPASAFNGVTVTQAALAVDVSKPQITKWCDAGEVDHVGKGRERLVDLNSLVKRKNKSKRDGDS